MNIRPFKDSDYETICSWLNFKPTKDVLSGSSTYVLENDNKLLFCLTIYFTNSKNLCLIENFAGNPNFKEERKKYSQYLWLYCERLAKEMGYKNVMVLSNIDKLTQKYEQFGYTKFMDNVVALKKDL